MITESGQYEETSSISVTFTSTDPVLSMWWWFNGALLSNSSRYSIETSGLTSTLTIQEVTWTDIGVYQAEAVTGTSYHFYDFSSEVINIDFSVMGEYSDHMYSGNVIS